MKKTIFFALLLGSVLLTACNEEPKPTQSEEKNQSTELSEENNQATDQSGENNQSTEQGKEKLSGNGTLQGHDYVDLGLPSGTLWATGNVNENWGPTFFSWGETTTKGHPNWDNYQYGSSYRSLTKYCSDSSYGLNGFTDTKTVLDAEDDVATAMWGSAWRMPTIDEFEELINNCTITRKSVTDGVLVIFTAQNGNSISLKVDGYATGASVSCHASAISRGCFAYYWSSSLFTENPSCALILLIYYSDVKTNIASRCDGSLVRPVVNQ